MIIRGGVGGEEVEGTIGISSNKIQVIICCLGANDYQFAILL